MIYKTIKCAVLLAVIHMYSSLYADEVRILSLSAEGELTWTNFQSTAYCRVEFARSPVGPWLGALSEPWRTFEQTNTIHSVVVPTDTRHYATPSPFASADGDAVFFRIVSFSASRGLVDRNTYPSTNSVVIFNASASAVSDISLSMVGATNTAYLASLLPAESSPTFFFVLPAAPTNEPIPISWSAYVGNYTHEDQTNSLDIFIPAYHTEIIVDTNGWHLW